MRIAVAVAAVCWSVAGVAIAASPSDTEGYEQPAARRDGEGQGPFQRLIIDGALLIDGTGVPARGPVSIVIEGNRIAAIESSSSASKTRQASDKVIDARGKYVLPGFIDTHVRILDPVGQGVIPPDYALKLMLAHGITAAASMNFGPLEGVPVSWALELQKRAASNSVVSPRLQVWFDAGRLQSPQQARQLMRKAQGLGIRGIGEGTLAGSPETVRAALDEVRKLGMLSHLHMQLGQCPSFNALDAARAGLNALTHWYCLPETMFEGQGLQRYPTDYNSADVRSRFRQSGRLWKQAAKPYSERWNKVLDEFLSLGFTFEPTFSVYEANRDVMGSRRAEWHVDYLHPSLERVYTPSPDGLFAHFYDWSSTDEAEWKENFRLWMAFVNEYKNRGGRVIAGADSGYMWTVFGFSFIRNLEMLEEAGFTPLEAISTATSNSAEYLGWNDIGSVQVGKLADLIVVDRNPLENLKVFYGTGFDSLLPDGTVGKAGGVVYTVKDGIVYDAKRLLADVKELVRLARAAKINATNK
ncbi:amidohydrolase family protein [Steroidobacter sp.]|uniref:amidohydrolase family protein n=1 Tax=Steroidobacter sp. TaxID=1978227 RepID=UPI001A424889|nr:amidohydrolase family protein [Steroidobacter sp.]MBL8268152.1 amidohydrolase family protein [Steroidobacter sp.]